MSFQAKAQVKMKILEDYRFRPGELKNVRMMISNNSYLDLILDAIYILPKNWEIVIYPQRVKLLNRDKKLLNIFIKAPAKITAGEYYFKLILKDKEKEYIKNYKLNIKKMNELKFNLVKSKKYINKEFKVQFQVINRGNTKRNLNLISNNVSIDNDKLILNPFEKKKVILNCRLNDISKNQYISILAETKKGDKFTIFNKELILLNHSRFSRKLKGIFSINYNYKNNNLLKAWRLKTFFKKQSYLTLQNNYFRLHYKNKNYLWQIGNEYINSFVQLGKRKNKLLKLSYQSNFNKFKRIIYTNFNNEFGIGSYYKNKNKLYYLELNNNNNNINYYFRGKIKRDDIVYSIKNYKDIDNIFYHLEIKKKFKNNDIFKTGLYSKGNNSIETKYFRYINDKINHKMTYGFNIKSTDYYKRKNITYINEYNKNNNEMFKLNYEINNNFYKKNKKFLEIKYAKNKFRINLRFNNIFKDKNIKFKISKYINTNRLKSLAIIDNYNGLRVGLENNFQYKIKGLKRVNFEGYYSYNFKKQMFNSNISFGVSVPLTYKNNEKSSLKIVVQGNNKDLSGIVFDINNKKVKTNKKGKVSAQINKTPKTVVQLVDLGEFKSEYFMKPKKQIITDKYNAKELEFKLVKFTNLKVKFKQHETFVDQYINTKNDETVIFRLYNKQNEYIKKYDGGQEIKFNKIKPGNYKLVIKVIKSQFEYSKREQQIKINPINNKIILKKSLKTSNSKKDKFKVNNLKIKK